MKRMAGIIVSTTLITWQNISAAIPNQSNNYIENNNPITIYCIGNHDATGNCFSGAEDSSKSSDIACVIASWPVVNCKNIEKEDVVRYACIALTNTNIQSQMSLSCTEADDSDTVDANKPNVNDVNKLTIPRVSSDVSDEALKNDSNFFGEAFQ